eukprot:CAMPEP_0171300668 /NCGR_PEP_ID=MMETSP0816-20121228/9527_1 /TAXON_ID=420281 /ORGANISM="Proboscia inermis, Strain CCAP1064/1" /LENGTH=102 /DNA_ID=CAMNT_0011777369 /DNA_START=80 /DNA_END=388 /DNA_ORIENTATION=-
MDHEVKRITETLAAEFARLYYNRFWLAPEMELVQNSIEFGQRDVEGSARMELYKENIAVLGRESEKSLYNVDLASMDIEGGGDEFDYNPTDAQFFLDQCRAA